MKTILIKSVLSIWLLGYGLSDCITQDFDLKLSYFINSGLSFYSDTINPYPNWQDNFLPLGGTMKYKTHTTRLDGDIGMVLEPVLKFKNKPYFQKLVIGFPVYLSVKTFTSYSPAVINVDWWNNVRVKDHKINYKLPTFGISMGISNPSSYFYSSILLTRYNLLDEDYLGRDCQGCTNTSHVFRDETIDKGWSKRIMAGFGKDYYKFDLNIGVYLDFATKKTVITGLYLKNGFSLMEKLHEWPE